MSTFLQWLPWVIIVGMVTWWWYQRNTTTNHEPVPLTPVPPPTRLPDTKTVMDLLDIGILFLAPNGVILAYNGAAAELLGLTMTSHGQTIMRVVRDHQLDDFIHQSSRRGERDEMLLPRRNPARTLKLSAQTIGTGVATPVILVLIRDVTQLSQLERARRDMIASVSHELRTPLAALKLLSETIATHPPAAIAERMALRISDEVDTLNHLVNDLHDLSQIEAGRIALQLAPHDPYTHIERVIERISPTAAEHAITVSYDASQSLPQVLSDAPRVDQVLLNLLHNAVKFTPDHGNIVIAASVIQVPDDHEQHAHIPANHAAGEWVLFRVTDTGVGIPAEHLPRIFERFYKVDQARTRGSGSGLGLAIARHLIEGHGGRIWVTSTVGSGTTFMFTLPTVHDQHPFIAQNT